MAYQFEIWCSTSYQSNEIWAVILRKIIKIVATRCQILGLERTIINLSLALPQAPLGSLERFPRPTSWNKWDLLLREEKACREGEEEEREEKGREEWEGRGGEERKGKGRERRGGTGREGETRHTNPSLLLLLLYIIASFQDFLALPCLLFPSSGNHIDLTCALSFPRATCLCPALSLAANSIFLQLFLITVCIREYIQPNRTKFILR